MIIKLKNITVKLRTYFKCFYYSEIIKYTMLFDKNAQHRFFLSNEFI